MRGRRELPAEGAGEQKRLERQRAETLGEIQTEQNAEARRVAREGNRLLPRTSSLREGFTVGQWRPPETWRPPENALDYVKKFERQPMLLPGPVQACGCALDHPHQYDGGDQPPRCTVPGCPHFLNTLFDGPEAPNIAPCMFAFGLGGSFGTRLAPRARDARMRGLPPGICGVARSAHTRANGLFHPFLPPDAERMRGAVTDVRRVIFPGDDALPNAYNAATDVETRWDSVTQGIELPAGTEPPPIWDAVYDQPVADIEGLASIERGTTIDIDFAWQPSFADDDKLQADVRSTIFKAIVSPKAQLLNPGYTPTATIGLAWAFGSNASDLNDLRIHTALQSGTAAPRFSSCGEPWRTITPACVIRGDLCDVCLDANERAGRARRL